MMKIRDWSLVLCLKPFAAVYGVNNLFEEKQLFMCK